MGGLKRRLSREAHSKVREHADTQQRMTTTPPTGGHAMTPDMAVQVAQLSWMEAAEQEVRAASRKNFSSARRCANAHPAARAQAATGDLEALLTETRGTLEKLAEGHFKLGSWQMVLWQPRWVYAEEDAFCYQKISADEVRAPPLRAAVPPLRLLPATIAAAKPRRAAPFPDLQSSAATRLVTRVRLLLGCGSGQSGGRSGSSLPT